MRKTALFANLVSFLDSIDYNSSTKKYDYMKILEALDKMKAFFTQPNVQYWGKFIGKTVFYFGILLMLIYLYHYKNIDGGTFIYNEF
ncbi:hypothetical protein A5881_000938 [Enterococcus termitis]|nr:hypothetical protein A5881_001150 [Enterococcus termitis]